MVGCRPTERGAEQAAQLGRRLAGVALTEVPVTELEAAGDYVPHLPALDEVDPEHRASLTAFLADVSPEEGTRGAELAAQAVDLLTGPVDVETHHLVVTHAFTIGWLLRDACAAPRWRWLTFDSSHAALTVIRYWSDRPPAVVMANDASHLTDPGSRP